MCSSFFLFTHYKKQKHQTTNYLITMVTGKKMQLKKLIVYNTQKYVVQNKGIRFNKRSRLQKTKNEPYVKEMKKGTS